MPGAGGEAVARRAGCAEGVVVFAAASLQTAFGAVAEVCEAESCGTAALSYAGGAARARQVEAGAPGRPLHLRRVDWMDYLAERG